MKKVMFFMLTLFFLSSASMNAQVNIGSKDSPKDGALLDLSRSGKNLGLILPNVNLTNVNDWQLDAGGGADAAGTVVFNTNAGLAANGKTLGQGIFVWNGNGWQAAKGGTGVVLAQDFTLMSNSDPFADGDAFNLYTGSTKSFTVDAGSFQPSSPDIAQGVKWVISPASIAAIKSGSTSTTCVVEGVSPGDANLTVTSLDNNVTKTITIHVLPVTLDAFKLDKIKLDLMADGDEGTVTAEDFVGTDGNPYSATVTWSIKDDDDPTGSAITPAGNTVTVKSGTVGSFTLRATAEGESRDCEVVISNLDPTAYSSTPPNGITVGLDGVFCYDVRSSLAADADYQLNVTGHKSIDKVTWVIKEMHPVQIVQIAPATLSNTNAHLEFKDQWYVSNFPAPTEITITAYIDLTLTDDTPGKTSVSKKIKFQNAPCCPGYTAENGAFTGSIPQQLASYLNIAEVLDAFKDATRSDLCISPDNLGGVSWNTANAAEWCSEKVHAMGGEWADGNDNWRLPNIGELANLQATKWMQEPMYGNIYSSTEDVSDQTRILLWAAIANPHTYGLASLTKASVISYARFMCVRD
ncbi:hypothetical protein FACS189437_10250 [Bacteroidia bacterium]|nr:hypothetical protein FACS189437_10250 [Bacteroidia bacterium]